MVSRSESPIRKKIDPKEFNSILVKEETFLLHCTINELQLAFIPLDKIQERRELLGTEIEPMESYLSMVNVSFYEMLILFFTAFTANCFSILERLLIIELYPNTLPSFN